MAERKRCLGLMFFIFFFGAGIAFSVSEGTPPPPKVDIYDFIGETDVYLEPTKFPVFSEGSCRENKKCSEWVEKKLSGLNRKDAADAEKGLLVLKDESVPGQYMMATYGRADTNCSGPGEFDFEKGEYKSTVGGGWIPLGNSEYTVLKLKDQEEPETSEQEENMVPIPVEYRDIAKLKFDWKVRVEGAVPNSFKCFKVKKEVVEVRGIQMMPLFCNARHSCSIKQDFSGGQVKMRLYIMGKDEKGNVIKANTAAGAEYVDGYAPFDPISEMTLPALDKITSITQNTPGDPTVTGSRVVTKDDFEGGELPAKIYFKLMWLNDSPVVARSLKEQRRVIAMLVPITDIKD